MRLNVPRRKGWSLYWDSDEFWAIREGEFRTWYGWVVEEIWGASGDYDHLTFSGSCVYCTQLGITDAYCSGYYDGYRGITNKRQLHCGVICEESDGVTKFEPDDTWTVEILGDKYDWRYRAASATYDPCYVCGEGFGNPQSKTLTRLPEIYQQLRDNDIFSTVSLVLQEDIDKKWFRDLWNSLVPPSHRKPTTETVPIEPTGDRFMFFYGQLSEQMDPVFHAGSGHCHPFGAQGMEDCAVATTCYAYPGGVGTEIVLGYWWHFIGPSHVYPIYFKLNGWNMDWYPDGLGTSEYGHIVYYDLNSY